MHQIKLYQDENVKYKKPWNLLCFGDVYGGLNPHVLPAPIKVCALLYSVYCEVIFLNQNY